MTSAGVTVAYQEEGGIQGCVTLSHTQRHNGQKFVHPSRKNPKIESFKPSGIVHSIVKDCSTLKIGSLTRIRTGLISTFSFYVTLCIGVEGEGGPA